MSFLKRITTSTLKLSKNIQFISIKSNSTTNNLSLNYDKNPAESFLNPNTQKLLKSMTRVKLEKVYQKRAVTNNRIQYKFMTTEEIEEELKNAIEKTYSRLQMPPIIQVQNDKKTILSKDPALNGFDTAKHIFTDITFGIPSSERTIVVRNEDGSLENANPEIRKRMNQIYFPQIGQNLILPKLFQDEHLNSCLDQLNYEFILNRICAQFEPYEQEFHEFTQRVFLHINDKTKQFDLLRSTRYFGPMVFFLAWHRLIDDLLIDMISRDYLDNGVELIALTYQLNGIDDNNETGENINDTKLIMGKLDEIREKKKNLLIQNVLPLGRGELQGDIESKVGKTKDDFDIDDLCYKFIQNYIKQHSLKKTTIQSVFDESRQLNLEKRQLFDGLQKAHGVI